MKANTFYFSHDFNARGDQKIKSLLMKWGMAGYGVYWAIVEDLYQNANALRKDSESIAFDLRVSQNMVDSIINDFELFVFDGDMFGSLSVQRRMDARLQKSASARESAYKRWDSMRTHSERNANAMQDECEGNAIKERKGKEIKGKENKGKEINNNNVQASPDGGFENLEISEKKKKSAGPNPEFIKAYCTFMEGRSLKARISPADARSLKDIEKYLNSLESVTTGRKSALELWNFLLDNWSHLTAWQQAQIQPRQINSQLPNMIETIKQHYNGTKTNGRPDHAKDAADLSKFLREKLGASGAFWGD